MRQCIENPNDLDWSGFWADELLKKDDKSKDWDKAAPHFHKKAKKDDYHEVFLSKLILSKDNSVLDLGCGEGSITIPIAKKVKNIIGVDSSSKMLELLNTKAEKENITNIKTIQKPIEEVSYSEIGDVDIVLASRSLNGIIPIEETLKTINKIANKYVFITLFGPDNWKIENEFRENVLKKPKQHFPGYNYLVNILYNIGIYANVERLDIKAYREYDSIDEAIDNGKFKPELLNDEELSKLRQYLTDILSKNPDNGKYYNVNDKADWILIWWKI